MINMQHVPVLRFVTLMYVLGTLAIVFACPVRAQAPAPKTVDRPSTFTIDALAMKKIRVPGDLKIEVFAAEPLVLNPVAFCIDERGRFYVAETFRLHSGVTDIRSHMDWLKDDLASRTVEDRVAMYRKHLGAEFETYAREEDRLRLIEDRDGDGKADHATVFADGFRDAADGIGAGVLARGGDVWFTCIPDLWKLKDTNGDGKADVRLRLQHGYGVHVGFLGHDLHGLKFGPDGRLYFSIGDRGLNVQTPKGTVASIDTGAVLRSDPDGSNLEVFASGLRNPQELTFDDYGNLFTVDNNSDSGDKARCVYLVEGGDSGWRIGYQFIESPVSRGPWNAEKLWHPQWDGQAAYLVPPLINITDGPSGFCVNPGTGLSESYRGRFFVCDFRGGSGNSGIRSFRMKIKGAAFEVIDPQEFVWSVLATDVDFGPDGALYFCDWVEGWEKPNKGRLYKLTPKDGKVDPMAAQTAKLLAEGFAGKSIKKLLALLSFPDQRVRQEAQFRLASEGEAIIEILSTFARDFKANELARIHAVWALGQIGRKQARAIDTVVDLLTDKSAEIRVQAAKVVGDARRGVGFDRLVKLLTDESPRVRFQAAIALGRLGKREAIGPIVKMLEENADKDPYLRHAGVMGLAGSNDLPNLLTHAGSASTAVRMGVLLALRRLGSSEIATFLDDPEPRLVLEAARAIHDVPIAGAMAQLAAIGVSKGTDEPLLLRVIDANNRVGGIEAAKTMAAIAVSGKASGIPREEALSELENWAQPSVLDRVIGVWRPIGKRSARDAQAALMPVLNRLLLEGPDRVASAAARAAAKLAIAESSGALLAIVKDSKKGSGLRVESLKALEAMQDPKLREAVKKAVDDKNDRVRSEGLRLLAALEPSETIIVLGRLLQSGTTREKQTALSILGGVDLPESDLKIAEWLDRLLAGSVPAELQLDVLEAAQRRTKNDGVKARLDRYEGKRLKGDPLAVYHEALEGGNAERGLAIFRENAQAQCLRCHKIHGTGGEVGPELTGIGGKQPREYLLESVVLPDKQIAKGFETIVLAKSDGTVVSGILKADEKDQIRLITAEGKIVVVPKQEIEEQKRGPSAMPLDLMKYLSKSQLRDLIEYLSSLK